MPTNALLSTLYLASPSLPTGAFAYSQGLEMAIENGLVSDADTLKSWCKDSLIFGLSEIDLSALTGCYDSIDEGNLSRFRKLNDQLIAIRETKELLLEELNLGKSLRRLLIAQTDHLALDGLSDYLETQQLTFVAAFAIASKSLELDILSARYAFLWAWLDNQVAVACKAIPLGQTDAQSVLLSQRSTIQNLVNQSNDSLCESFGSLPGTALLSALHEEQYSRLFRS